MKVLNSTVLILILFAGVQFSLLHAFQAYLQSVIHCKRRVLCVYVSAVLFMFKLQLQIQQLKNNESSPRVLVTRLDGESVDCLVRKPLAFPSLRNLGWLLFMLKLVVYRKGMSLLVDIRDSR